MTGVESVVFATEYFSLGVYKILRERFCGSRSRQLSYGSVGVRVCVRVGAPRNDSHQYVALWWCDKLIVGCLGGDNSLRFARFISRWQCYK